MGRSLDMLRLDQCVEVMRQLRPSLMLSELENLVAWRYRFITVLRDEKVVGVGAYYPTASLVRGKFIYLADLVTDSGFRSRGVGAEMLADVLSVDTVCELDSGLEKEAAHRFYERHGFHHVGYAVRPQLSVMSSLSDLPTQLTYLIDGANKLAAKSKDIQLSIQAFINQNIPAIDQVNLHDFMCNNTGHRLLVLEGAAGAIEGILLFELQYRLSFAGNCFHVTDMIVKDRCKHRESQLLLSLLQLAKQQGVIKTVVVEMTEDDLDRHSILKGSKACEVITNNMTINQFFTATAKHFSVTSAR